MLSFSQRSDGAPGINCDHIDLQLTISPMSTERSGLPIFRATVTNLSDATVRALDIPNIPNTEGVYFDLRITALTEGAEVWRALSHHVDVLDVDDLVELEPGEVWAFDLMDLPTIYGPFDTGRYEARAIFLINPSSRPIVNCTSPPVAFNVAE